MKIFTHFGSGLGCVQRTLTTVTELKKRGHLIRYLGRDNAKQIMKAVDIEPLNAQFNIGDMKKGPQQSAWKSPEHFWGMIYWDLEWLESKIDQLCHYLHAYNPDLIMSDAGILSLLAARIIKIPLVTVCQSCYHPERPYRTIRYWEPEEDLNLSFMDKLNEMLNKKGAKTVKKFEELFTGDLTIIPSIPEFDPVNSVTSYNSHYVGPLVWNPPYDTVNGDFGQYRKGKRPRIFCYTARFFDNVGESGAKIFRAVALLHKKLDAEIVVSTGSHDDTLAAKRIIEEMHIPAEAIQLVDWLPMKIAYGQSDIVIHHGGHGSCLAQVMYQIPSVIVPTHTEREYNARMLKQLGAAEIVQEHEINSSDFSAKILHVLGSKNYKDALQGLHAELQSGNYGGSVEMVNQMERLHAH